MKYAIMTAILILLTSLVWADAMPDFRLPDANGKNVSLESLLGKGAIMIDFWADYCKPCKQSMPLLNELALKYDSLTVVMISIDKPKDQPRAKNYLNQNKFKFITLFDPDRSLAGKLNVDIPPHTFILDATGEIVYSHKGFDPALIHDYEQHIRVILGYDFEAE